MSMLFAGPTQMNIFISWSGTRSNEVAGAMRIWIHEVIHTTRPWMSETGIPAGARWQNEIALRIQEADFGIICLTANNQHSPWLLFEAGALAKAIIKSGTYVCPYLIDLDEMDMDDGPLRQFQSKRADKHGTWQLIETINKAMKNSPLTETELRRSFERCWPELKKVLDNPASEVPPRDTRLGMEVAFEQILIAHLKQFECRLENIVNLLNEITKNGLNT